MDLVGLTFGETFAFARPIAADYRDGAGILVEAPAGVPRLDHDDAGRPIGLLVEEGPYLGAGDRLAVPAGDWEIGGPGTVFHELLGGGGEAIRRAVYSRDVRATVNGLLASAGHHRRIGAVAGFLKNRGGFVRYREMDWELPAAIGAAAGLAIGDGDAPGRILLEG